MAGAGRVPRKIGKYEIQAELGHGGFGRVFRALDPDVRRPVAIKVLFTQDDQELRSRFQFEAAAAGNLTHKNIVTIYEFGEYQEQPFLVMEFLEGQTLHELIARQEKLLVLQKMSVMSQVADGLQCAHSHGVVHRDVKPANIMVSPAGTVKIMDFGIARATQKDATRLTQAGHFFGTLRYMTPEQFENIDPGILGDIFAYGVVYYEFLTGKHPFDAPDAAGIMFKIRSEDPPPLRESVPDCPEALERIIIRALAKDRSLRYQTLEELQFDAEPLIVGLRKRRAEELLEQANDFASADRAGSAVTLLRELLDLDPSNHEALLLRSGLQQRVHQKALVSRIEAALKEGNELIGQDKFPEAIRAFESGLRLDPRNPEVQWALNRARGLQQSRQRASELIAEARSLQRAQDLAGALHKASEAMRVDSQNLEAKSVIEAIRGEVARRERESRWKSQVEKIEGLLVTQEFDEALSLIDSVETGVNSQELGGLRARIVAEKSKYEQRQRLADYLSAARQLIRQGKFEDAVRRLEPLEAEYSCEEELTGLLRHARDQWRIRERTSVLEEIKGNADALSTLGAYQQAVEVVEQGLLALPGDSELLDLLERTLAAKAQADHKHAVQESIQRIEDLRQSGKLLDALQYVDASIRTLGEDLSLRDLQKTLHSEWDTKKRNDAVRAVIQEARTLIEDGRSSSALFRLRSAAVQFPGEESIQELLDVAQEKVRDQQRAQTIQAVRNEVGLSLGARDLDHAINMVRDALEKYPGERGLLALRESVEASRAAWEREKRIQEVKLACERRRREQRFDDALAEVTTAIAELGDDPHLLSLKDQFKHELEEQNKIVALRDIANRARELLDDDKPEAAIQAIRGSTVDPGVDAELSGLIRIAESTIADRLRTASIRQITARVDRLIAAGQFAHGRKVLEEGQAQFPDNADLSKALIRLEERAKEAVRQEEISRRILDVEGKIAARDWTAAIRLIEESPNHDDPAFVRLRELARRSKEESEGALRQAIADVLVRAAEQERQGNLLLAVSTAEDGLELYPESSAIRETLSRLCDLMRRQGLAKEIAQRAIAIEQQIATKNWEVAFRMIADARRDLGSHGDFDRLSERVRSGETARAAEQRTLIQAILDRAQLLAKNEQFVLALQSIEDGLRLYPESAELAHKGADIARESALRKRRRRISEQVAIIEQHLTDGNADRAVVLAEGCRREFSDEVSFVDLLERSRAAQRAQLLEVVITKIRAAVTAGGFETATALLTPALKHFDRDDVLIQIEKEIAIERSRRNKLANVSEMLLRGRFGAAEKLCREILAMRPDDPEAIATLERVSARRFERAREREKEHHSRSLRTWGFLTTGVVVIAGVTFYMWYNPNQQTATAPIPRPSPTTGLRAVAPASAARTPTAAAALPTKSPTVRHGIPETPKPLPLSSSLVVSAQPASPTTEPPTARMGDDGKVDCDTFGGAHTGTVRWSGSTSEVLSGVRINDGVPNMLAEWAAPAGVSIIERPNSHNNWTLVFDPRGLPGPLTFTWQVCQN